jgi:hypothetical protein
VQAFAFSQIFADEIVTPMDIILPVPVTVEPFLGVSGLSNAAVDFEANTNKCAAVFTEL